MATKKRVPAPTRATRNSKLKIYLGAYLGADEPAEFPLANVDNRTGKWWFVPPLAELPTLVERQSLKHGDSVMLVFGKPGDWEEQVQVTVTVVLDGGHYYIGRLTKKPTLVALQRGDLVAFGAEHVATIEPR